MPLAMRILSALCAALLSASCSFGATVVVLPGTPPLTPAVLNADQTLLMSGRFRVGYFVNQTDEGLLRFALSTPGLVNVWMEQYFVPLGEPEAPIFNALGGGVPALGSIADFSQSLLGTSGFFGVNGRVTGGGELPLLFASGVPPDTYSLAGVPRGSRLFLVAYPTADISNADGAGIFSATQWFVPFSITVQALSMPMFQVDTQEEIFRGNFGSFGSQRALVLPFVPEPSCPASLAIGTLLLTRRRRTTN